MRGATFLLAAVAAVLAASLADGAPVSSNKWIPDMNSRGMWVWDQQKLPSNAAGMTAFFNFLKAPHGRPDLRINRIMFYAGLSNVNTGNTALRNFLKMAHAQGVSVELLEGDPQWVTTASGVQSAVSVCSQVAAFNAATPGSDDDFDGVHLDIEPHVLAGWTSNSAGGGDAYNQLYESNFISVFKQCQTVMNTKSPNTLVAADIAWWYSTVATDLYSLIQNSNALDYVSIMAYFDTYSPFSNAISVNLANTRIPVNIGIETIDPNSAPDAQSFYQEGWVPMEQQLRKAYDAYSTRQFMSGFSIHHYGSFAPLQSGPDPSTLPVRNLPDSKRPGAVVVPVPPAAPTTTAAVKKTSSAVAPVRSTAPAAPTTTAAAKKTSSAVAPAPAASSVPAPARTSAAPVPPATTSAAPSPCGCRSVLVDPFTSAATTNSFGLSTGADNTMQSIKISGGSMQLTPKTTSDYWYTMISTGCYDLSPYEWVSFTFSAPAGGSARLALQTSAAGCANARGTDYGVDLAKYTPFDGTTRSVMVPLADFAALGANIQQIRALVVSNLATVGTYSVGKIRFVGCDA